MKMLFIVTLAAAGAVASYMAPSPMASAPGIDPTTTSAVGTGNDTAGGGVGYTVANINSNASCLLTTSTRSTPRTIQVHAETACDDVWPGLSDARNWTRNSDGSVTISAASGAQVLQLAPGDGIAFQAIAPRRAQLVLTLAN